MSDKVKEKIIAFDEQVKKPFTFEYFEGYDRFIVQMFTTGLMVAFLAAFLIASIFCGEYRGSDQIILSSKNGKNSLIKAKLFTGFTITTAIVLAGTLLTYLLCMMIFGFDGFNAVLQLKIPLCTLPFTIGQLSVICFICVYFACILLCAITMFLSAKLKSSFVAITICGMTIFVPMFIKCSNHTGILYQLYLLLPSNMMKYNNMINPVGYEIFGIVLQPYVVIPIFSILISIILMSFAYKIFQHHQVE